MSRVQTQDEVVAGRVIVLNGTASAGKTSLAHAIQQAATDLWVIVSQDDFAQNLVPRWVAVEGAFEAAQGGDGFHFVRDENGHLHVEVGAIGRRMLRGYRFAVAAIAHAGNDVIVDECTFDPDGVDDWNTALAGLRSWNVRVECDLDVCEQRERARPDRAQLQGLARGQYERTHAGVSYDLTVDLTNGDLDRAAATVLSAVSSAALEDRG